MSLRQVDLMCADCAVTVYPGNDKEKSKSKGKHEFKEMSKEEIEAKRKQWEERFPDGKFILDLKSI